MAVETSKSLVIVESPAKAKTISRFLGPKYQVEASYGHVRDLPQSRKDIPAAIRSKGWADYGVDIEGSFEPVYVVPKDKKEHVKRLKEALKEADSLLLATDEDREGESISWHVLELLKPKKSTSVQRIVFHEVTPEAIQKALDSPRQVDENLVRAQEARRVVDRLYGYSLSPLLWKRVAPGLSAGRVQSVAVKFLVERERERIAFVPAEYWDLKAELETADKKKVRVKLARIDDQRLAEGKSFDPRTGILADTKRLHLKEERAGSLARSAKEARPWLVSSVDRQPGSQKPAPPFTTSTLQQEANRKLRMTSRQTMRVAQRLYEGIDLEGERVGLITYMRTDSVTLADRAVSQARQLIGEIYGEDFLPSSGVQYKTKAKRAQEAHEAVRPTDLTRRPQDVKAFLNDDELRLYELIWKRTVACQMVAAQFERTSVEVSVETEGAKLLLTTSGRRIVFPGFLRAYVEGSDDPEAQLGDQETLLPALEVGQELEPIQVDADGHVTKPVYRYTEASLVKKLEEEGIGRPSTYASIISTIQDRGYAFKKNNELTPTFTAFCVTELLESQFEDLIDTHFTARMEDNLDEIAEGRVAWDELVATFFRGGEDQPGLRARVEQGEVLYPAIRLGHEPESGDEVIVKIGRGGHPYVRLGQEGEKARVTAPIPEGTAPDELTLEMALDLLKKKSDDAPVAMDAATGRSIFLKVGRFGAYFELEQTEAEKDDAKAKPHRVSLPRDLKADDVTPEMAQSLISLPRSLGAHPDDGEEVVATLGRYGPYIKKGKDSRSLSTWMDACEIQMEQAVEILKQPKKGGRGRAQKVVLKELGEIADAEGPVQILDGRYGPYVSDGVTNATIPRGTDPESVTVEQAKELLDARRKAPKKKKPARKKAAPKKAATKKKTTKK